MVHENMNDGLADDLSFLILEDGARRSVSLETVSRLRRQLDSSVVERFGQKISADDGFNEDMRGRMAVVDILRRRINCLM